MIRLQRWQTLYDLVALYEEIFLVRDEVIQYLTFERLPSFLFL